MHCCFPSEIRPVTYKCCNAWHGSFNGVGRLGSPRSQRLKIISFTKGLAYILLLMEEILHHLGCVNLVNNVNNGINYLSTGAGFQPSTVSTNG